MRFKLIAILLIGVSLKGIAQNSELEQLIESEKKHFNRNQNFISTPFSSTNDIIYHRINWEVDPAIKYISGSVCSYFQILSDNVSLVHFDLTEPLVVDSVIHATGNLTFTHENSIIEIQLNSVLHTNDIDSLTVYYHGEPPGESGFGSFIIGEHSGDPILWTLSEPYGAKEWWPCKQNLSDKIDSIDIHITVPEGNKVGSNGVLVSQITQNSKTSFHWKHRYPIASYLVAIAVTNYAEFKDYADIGDGKQVEILNYVYPEQLEANRELAKYTVDVMELFSQLFIPYPFADEKYGHAQFGWGGGMEHQTMSFMGSFSKGLIAHELAHQWFGDYVTCGSWEDIWINESFATYLTGISEEHLGLNGLTNWKTNIINRYIPAIADGSIIVDDTTSVSRIFSSALSYNKGGFVLHMLRTQIGDEAFFEGCKLLLTDNQTSAKFARTPQVQACFETAADTNLSDFFNEWIYGEGYPSFVIRWDQSIDQTVSFKIIQYTTHESVTCFKMYIPILFKGDGVEKLVHFHQVNATQKYSYNPGFAVNKIEFDPDYNLLAPHPAIITLDVEEKNADNVLHVFPNPAKDELVIRCDKQNSLEEIKIISSEGKQISLIPNTEKEKKITLDISTYNNGVYFIKAKVNNQEIVQRFVKN